MLKFYLCHYFSLGEFFPFFNFFRPSILICCFIYNFYESVVFFIYLGLLRIQWGIFCAFTVFVFPFLLLMYFFCFSTMAKHFLTLNIRLISWNHFSATFLESSLCKRLKTPRIPCRNQTLNYSIGVFLRSYENTKYPLPSLSSLHCSRCV